MRVKFAFPAVALCSLLALTSLPSITPVAAGSLSSSSYLSSYHSLVAELADVKQSLASLEQQTEIAVPETEQGQEGEEEEDGVAVDAGEGIVEEEEAAEEEEEGEESDGDEQDGEEQEEQQPEEEEQEGDAEIEEEMEELDAKDEAENSFGSAGSSTAPAESSTGETDPDAVISEIEAEMIEIESEMRSVLERLAKSAGEEEESNEDDEGADADDAEVVNEAADEEFDPEIDSAEAAESSTGEDLDSEISEFETKIIEDLLGLARLSEGGEEDGGASGEGDEVETKDAVPMETGEGLDEEAENAEDAEDVEALQEENETSEEDDEAQQEDDEADEATEDSVALEQDALHVSASIDTVDTVPTPADAGTPATTSTHSLLFRISHLWLALGVAVPITLAFGVFMVMVMLRRNSHDLLPTTIDPRATETQSKSLEQNVNTEWQICYDDCQRAYYVNVTTGVSQWSRPEELGGDDVTV